MLLVLVVVEFVESLAVVGDWCLSVFVMVLLSLVIVAVDLFRMLCCGGVVCCLVWLGLYTLFWVY